MILRDGLKVVTDAYERVNLLNSFFSSSFSCSFSNDILPNSQGVTCAIEPLATINLSKSEVLHALKNLDPNKACGPDNLPGRLLKEAAELIAPSLCQLFNISLSLGHFPTIWKRANVAPIFKKDDPSLPSNYRPISLLCILSKVFERCVSYHCQHHLLQFICDFQHGFRKGRSTEESQLLEVYHDILDSLARGKEGSTRIFHKDPF
jgi:hypothetical protein